jgi:histidinol-phosphate/aromatic aminotransferase/cobyric acid decarboxylase-like protein/choline kinase
MKAIILAAGLGNRMRPLTQTVPKALIEVGGRCMIGRIVDVLLDNHIRTILVVTGYRAGDIERWLRLHYSDVDFQFLHNERYEETNNIVSTALAFEHLELDDDILLIESDLVCEPAVLERIIKSPHPDVALVDRYRPGFDGTVVTVAGGIVTSVIPPHLQLGEFSFADKFKTLNIYKFSREFCRGAFRQLLTYYARSIDCTCYYELILGILIYVQKAVIRAEILDGEAWAELDDPNDLRVAEFTFNRSRRRRILEEAMGGYWSFGDVVDFNFIRNMYFPTPAMLAEIRTALPQLIHNYGSTQALLNQKLAYLLLCAAERVNVLNGASQLYPYLSARFGHCRALLPDPTFGEYARGLTNHARYGDRIGIDPAEIESGARKAEVVVFVNPNNPTGTTIPTDWIYAFAQAHPQCMVLVDESFAAFAMQRPMISLLEERPISNVVVLTSLSKSFGVPGLRLGYVYTCDRELSTDITRWLPIWNLNSIAEYLLEIVLKHRESLAASIDRTIAVRLALSEELRALPCVREVHPSGGNFLLVTLGSEVGGAASVVERLLEHHGIWVKDVSDRIADGDVHLRVAVRLPEENRRFCAALEECHAARARVGEGAPTGCTSTSEFGRGGGSLNRNRSGHQGSAGGGRVDRADPE